MATAKSHSEPFELEKNRVVLLYYYTTVLLPRDYFRDKTRSWRWPPPANRGRPSLLGRPSRHGPTVRLGVRHGLDEACR